MRYRLALGVLAVALAVGVAAAAAAPAAAGAQANETGNDTATLAPGLSTDGVTDPFALAQAHHRVLRNASYTVTTQSTHRYGNGTLVGTLSTTTAVAADGERTVRSYGTFRNASAQSAVTQYERLAWSNGTLSLTAVRFGDGEVEYDRGEGSAALPRSADTDWETIYAAFNAANTTVVGEVEDDGRTLYRVVATDVRADSTYVDDQPFTMTALVDERGVVHSLVVTHPTSYEGTPAFVTQQIRVTNVGNTTVEQPDWYDDALANATE